MELIDREREIQFIENLIKNRKYNGSFLFTGIEGIGKLLTAKYFAARLLCRAEEKKPCFECPPCVKILKNKHLDVIMIDKTRILIDDMRENISALKFTPVEAFQKFFIVNDAHNMNKEAQNTFLKFLEEPLSDVTIILITHKPQELYPTIISRCRNLIFTPLTREKIKVYLIKNNVPPPEASAVSLSCGGSLKEALNLSSSKLSEKIKDIVEFALNGKTGIKKEIEDAGIEFFLNELKKVYMDILLLKSGVNFNIINTDYIEEFKKDKTSSADIIKKIKIADRLLVDLKKNLPKQTAVEVILANG